MHWDLLGIMERFGSLDRCNGDRPRRKQEVLNKRLTLFLSNQVLFKRKPVQYLPRPVIEDDSSEVRTTGGIRAASPTKCRQLTCDCYRSG